MAINDSAGEPDDRGHLEPDRAAAGGTTSADRRLAWPRIGLAIVFGLLYAYDLFEAIANLVGMSTGLSGTGLVPWVPLIIGVAVPPIVFVLAALVARRRTLGLSALVYLVGLAVVAALSLDLEGYVQTLFR